MSQQVFVSRPTVIGLGFENSYAPFEEYLRCLTIEPIRLGPNSYTLDPPLETVINLMDRCEGAIVLGYPQYEFRASIAKGGVEEHKLSTKMPTPWNHIEAALAFRQGIPVLIVAQNGVSGGVFDYGITGQFVLKTNLHEMDWHKKTEFQTIFHDWRSRLKHTIR